MQAQKNNAQPESEDKTTLEKVAEILLPRQPLSTDNIDCTRLDYQRYDRDGLKIAERDYQRQQRAETERVKSAKHPGDSSLHEQDLGH